LIAGAMLVGTVVVLWALILLFRYRAGSRTRRIAYAAALVAMWGVGFINALVHARDAWASMPHGMYLSIVVTLLALAASWIGYSGFRAREVA
jgi:hypothetical protein